MHSCWRIVRRPWHLTDDSQHNLQSRQSQHAAQHPRKLCRNICCVVSTEEVLLALSSCFQKCPPCPLNDQWKVASRRTLASQTAARSTPNDHKPCLASALALEGCTEHVAAGTVGPRQMHSAVLAAAGKLSPHHGP